jgi:hypothetical protein
VHGDDRPPPSELLKDGIEPSVAEIVTGVVRQQRNAVDVQVVVRTRQFGE